MAMMEEEGYVEHKYYLRSLLADGVFEGDRCLSSAKSSLCQNSNANSNLSADLLMWGKQKRKERKLNEFFQKAKDPVAYLILGGDCDPHIDVRVRLGQ